MMSRLIHTVKKYIYDVMEFSQFTAENTSTSKAISCLHKLKSATVKSLLTHRVVTLVVFLLM